MSDYLTTDDQAKQYIAEARRLVTVNPNDAKDKLDKAENLLRLCTDGAAESMRKEIRSIRASLG